MLFRIFIPLTIFSFAFFSCSRSEGGPPPGMKIKVVVAEVLSKSLAEDIGLVGSLAAFETISLDSKIEGVVEEITFEEGQQVEVGTPLFKINEKKLAASFAEAEADFKLAQANIQRARALRDDKTISSQEFDQAVANFDRQKAFLERVKELLQDAYVPAPFTGIMGARLVSPGQLVKVGTPLSSLVSIDPIRVEGHIPERFLSKLKSGLKLNVTVQAYPDLTFAGEIYFVSPQVDEITRTVLVKGKIKNDSYLLKPGMFADVTIITDSLQDTLLIPESAVIVQGTQAYVYKVGAENKAERQNITTGIRFPGLVQVTSGLSIGDLVVTEGTQKLRPGADLETTKTNLSEFAKELPNSSLKSKTSIDNQLK